MYCIFFLRNIHNLLKVVLLYVWTKDFGHIVRAFPFKNVRGWGTEIFGLYARP